MNIENKFFSNENLMDSIWINYPENRIIREQIAYTKWQDLYLDNNTDKYKKYKLNDILSTLDIFKKYTKGNIKLCNKLVGDVFIKIRKKYSKFIFNKDDFDNNHEFAGKSQGEELNLFYKNIEEEIKNEFYLEYEKMERISSIFNETDFFEKYGWDLSSFDKEDIKNIYELQVEIEEKDDIKEFLNKIGRRNYENKKHFKKKSKLGTELFGISHGNNIKNLLPSEFSLLHNKVLKKYFYAKYSEKTLLNYSMRNNTYIKNKENRKGPIILCVDNSSSMAGKGEILAKSISLFILKKAWKEKRKLYLINFASKKDMKELELTEEEKGLSRTLNFFKKSFFGGTDYKRPIERSLELMKTNNFSKAEILFISDGLGEVSQEFLNKIEYEKQKLNFKIYSILINAENKTPEFMDEIFFYSTKKYLRDQS